VDKLELALYLKQLGGAQRVCCQILFAVFPILAGIKFGELVSFWEGSRKECWSFCESLCGEASIHARELHRTNRTFLVLFYDPAALDQVLAITRMRRLLRAYGYPPDGGKEEALARLRARFARYGNARCSKQAFPHEVGVFLGYPPKDVEAFIAKGGKECLCCRYWKVYHDEPAAREVFCRIDAARQEAIRLFRGSDDCIIAPRLATHLSSCHIDRRYHCRQ
jgi:hypothetical protein